MTRIAPTYERTIPMSEIFQLLEMQPPQDDPRIALAIRLYKDGMGVEDVCREARVSNKTLKKWLEGEGITIRHGKMRRTILAMHKEGKTVDQIVEATGYQRSNIRESIAKMRLKSAGSGQKPCTPLETRRMTMLELDQRTRVAELWAAGFDHFEIAYQVCGVSSDKVLEWCRNIDAEACV
jgi:AraC-like DNA-binding protein